VQGAGQALDEALRQPRDQQDDDDARGAD
jgi:hypothetical protein